MTLGFITKLKEIDCLYSFSHFVCYTPKGYIPRSTMHTACCFLLAVAILPLWLAIAPPSIAAPLLEIPDTTTPDTTAASAALFTENCAACHANGGNIIRRGKNLKRRAMVRNGYGEVSAIASIVTNGKGIMPAYADKLSGEEIRAIAQYVHEQSEAGW